MKTFIMACVVAIVIAACAALVLEGIQASSQAAYSTAGARV
jgi:hypothetical protein